MDSVRTHQGEQLLRGLAAGDESLLQSVLAVSPAAARPLPPPWPASAGRGAEGSPVLSPAISALLHIAGLLAAGGSTTSLRWAVELALRAGARKDDIVEVLISVASIMGAVRVVAAAPRLALAIGYDIEVDGWDGY